MGRTQPRNGADMRGVFAGEGTFSGNRSAHVGSPAQTEGRRALLHFLFQ